MDGRKESLDLLREKNKERKNIIGEWLDCLEKEEWEKAQQMVEKKKQLDREIVKEMEKYAEFWNGIEF